MSLTRHSTGKYTRPAMPDMFAQMKVAPALAPVAKPVEEMVAWALTLDHFTCEVMWASTSPIPLEEIREWKL